MKVLNFARSMCLVASAAILTACGGGGGSGNDSGFNPPGISVSASATSGSVQAGRTVDITVRVTQAGGAPIVDGTRVLGAVSPANIGSIVSIGPNGPTGNNEAATVGGLASFRFTGTSQGNALLTFSAQDPSTPGRNISASVTVQVTAGIERLTLEATTTTLPINAFNVRQFIGSPYMAEVTITLRSSSGQLVNQPDGVAVSVNPVGITGGFSTLDDPETDDVNEFSDIRLGQGPVDVVAGKATVFMHSLNFAGQSTMTVTGTDPDTNETVTASLVFNIVSTTTNLPAEVAVSPTTAPQYIQSSGGNTSGQFEVRVNDAIGQPVPNPVAGSNAFNNVRLEIIGDANGARLTGINAQGQSVSGTAISVRTIGGITGGALISGTIPGNVLIRATSDRADNNVDNGVSDAVTGQRTVAVSDGVLFDLDITTPIQGAIVVNPPDITSQPGDIPPAPDATYSLTVSAIATDRLGNPVLPGTTISFGNIDEPQASGFGDFFLSGLDGNPLEGGVTFNAPGGAFTFAGGGAGPGDALVLFGEDVIGNRDHESARRVASVQTNTTLTVNRRFNNNDTTGAVVNSGPVLPYIIGRSADGNITASGTTNEIGVVTVKMNYPVSKLGKSVVVWAQGDGDLVGGTPETVADVEGLVFAGVAPATLSVFPSTIPGNASAAVTACVFDALGSGIGGVTVGFAFESLDGGQGDLDGVASSGTFANVTGFNGCTSGVATTTGITSSGGALRISALGESDTIDIEIGELILTANPALFVGAGGTTTLRLVDAGGNPVANAQISGTCTGSGGANVSTSPVGNGVTNANGEADFDIFTSNLNQIGSAGEGTCTYEVAGGDPSVDVTIQGIDLCSIGVSPQPPGCPTP
ncbi:beta strand repeat-containing protein [Pseudomarimonas arenosa]|uniref:Big-1 domain-containing protein n=1 Tax=Pseudomarimonas arenosa TaxID=2774145 RepID=A0AAW3ZJB7_9GAMM|nr:hypothetical protein [Pseudomarimonas arenosa]MBD8525025.1 hypothetical protein [Pseudomarimonas arenosa]